MSLRVIGHWGISRHLMVTLRVRRGAGGPRYLPAPAATLLTLTVPPTIVRSRRQDKAGRFYGRLIFHCPERLRLPPGQYVYPAARLCRRCEQQSPARFQD